MKEDDRKVESWVRAGFPLTPPPSTPSLRPPPLHPFPPSPSTPVHPCALTEEERSDDCRDVRGCSKRAALPGATPRCTSKDRMGAAARAIRLKRPMTNSKNLSAATGVDHGVKVDGSRGSAGDSIKGPIVIESTLMAGSPEAGCDGCAEGVKGDLQRLGWPKQGVSSKKQRRRARKWSPLVGCLLKNGPAPAVMEVRQPLGNRRRLVEAVVDSGAEASVADPGDLPGELRESAMSKAKQSYMAANRSEIPNLGEKDVSFRTDEGFNCGIPFQCAKVAKPLIAATQLTEAGNDVIFSKKYGKIVNMDTKREIKLIRRGGVYILRMWVKDDPSQTPKEKTTVFPRQGAK